MVNIGDCSYYIYIYIFIIYIVFLFSLLAVRVHYLVIISYNYEKSIIIPSSAFILKIYLLEVISGCCYF